MLDRHAIQELLRADVPVRQIARQFAISRWTVRRIAREAAIASSEEATSRAHRGIGRPRVSEAIRARVATLVGDDPTVPPGEIARRLREEGTPLGLSTLYRVLGGVRATLPTELLVRFEGLAGEFAQFDFGEVSVAVGEGPPCAAAPTARAISRRRTTAPDRPSRRNRCGRRSEGPGR